MRARHRRCAPRRPIETAPRAGAVLTANVGRPNSTAQGEPTPALSLLGLQTRARSWRSGADTYFAMALLTPSGLARLMPGCGSGTADALIDFGGAVGDRAARAILEDAAARPDGTGIAAALDDWLLARLTAGAASRSVDLFDAACRGSPAGHASRRRQGRWCDAASIYRASLLIPGHRP